ncbi:hypothetical protein B566_EDAN004598 [Ephemera danica]|nr:hypothetical protein B566_EDAN004598 [Ephemera danica]
MQRPEITSQAKCARKVEEGRTKWEQCFRCVVIHEKHHNVLQYKETFCVPRGPLEQLCGEITGDATLFSMFRSDAAPVACPFKGPFSFTYNRGSGECARPPSRIDSCAEDSRLRMRYQACADVLGSESSSEELECLATWKDGNTRYLVGKLAHKMASTDEDRYRCFVYERAPHEHPPTFRVAQSGDATCNGLLSATEGSRTMRLTKESHASQCKFPGWVTEHHHWRTLDHRRSFQFSHKNATLRISNETSRDDETGTTSLELRATCHSQLDVGERHVLLVAHVTLGCSLCLCVSEVCVYMVCVAAASLKPRKCPYLGRYTVSSLTKDGARASRSRSASSAVTCSSEELESLVVGCRATDTMEFHSSCGTEPVSAYSCHGSWEDNGTHFLVASPLSRRSTGARRFCFVYAETDRGLHFSSVADVCERIGVSARPGSWAFNATLDEFESYVARVSAPIGNFSHINAPIVAVAHFPDVTYAAVMLVMPVVQLEGNCLLFRQHQGGLTHHW